MIIDFVGPTFCSPYFDHNFHTNPKSIYSKKWCTAWLKFYVYISIYFFMEIDLKSSITLISFAVFRFQNWWTENEYIKIFCLWKWIISVWWKFMEIFLHIWVAKYRKGVHGITSFSHLKVLNPSLSKIKLECQNIPHNKHPPKDS
jgi:hypothetical protein